MGVPVIDDRLLRADLRNQRIAHKIVLMHRLSRGMRSTAFDKIATVYGQITGKSRFVRKMRFAYGQISKKWHFVRKFE